MIDRAPAATLVIFGATGDPTRRLLAPAPVHLMGDGLLDDGFKVLGVAREMGDDAMLCDRLENFLREDGALEEEGDQRDWDALRDRISYRSGDFADEALFTALATELSGPVIFYLATAPSFFGPLVDALQDAGLLDEADGFRKIAVEKPFGTDLASSCALNARLLGRAAETQIFRVDHFLGKETVQNIMLARFGNALTEAVWNNRYVDHVQITVAETVPVGSRGAFYDATGALCDMVANHLFQLLAMVAMEPPNRFDAEAIRDEKARVLKAVHPVRPEDTVRGRYVAGEAGGKSVVDYRAEQNVAEDSRTETCVAAKVAIDIWRWAGVPFYLRTGKALTARESEIVIGFRDAPATSFEGVAGERPANELVIQIQPREGLHFGIVVKQPGPTLTTASVALDFCYAETFGFGRPTGYETLIYDLLIGDQTLFQRADMVEACWTAVVPLIEAWRQGEPEDYAAGTTGPAGAAALMARGGRTWRAIA
ncbi:glucose-6-phosphate dehydrogenase [Sphingomonas sp. PAMC 26605]|uniref:glucose-6-phosphate dehydrogenase n=1 Tax=Sphingomonas sp. PAMC 26605 TaxID=1112214 RepID=UPI00026CB5D9|nr:glucose-6-phosphate dehydrogenase [Sphingomonas sp. PAMC 26605]